MFQITSAGRMPRHLVAVLIAVLVSAGCSRTQLAYRNADWLAYRWVDGLFDADAAQQARWSDLLERLADRHRRELLPRVVDLLDRAAREAGRGLTRDGLDCLWQSTDDLINDHARLALEAAVDVLDDVSPMQLAHLQRRLAERNAAYSDDYLEPDPAARALARFERYAERIERWTGDLDTAQVRLLEAAVSAMPDIAEAWLGYRERQQAQLLHLLHAGVGRDAIRTFLSAWWVDRAGRGPQLVERGERFRDGWFGLLAALDRSLNAHQRTRLVDRIGAMRDDLAAELSDGLNVAAAPPGTTRCGQVL